MKCEICGKSPSDGKTTLLRQNPKGETGIWRCEQHNKNIMDVIVAQTVAELQSLNKRKTSDLTLH